MLAFIVSNLDVLPVGPPPGVQEIRVHVVFLVREVRFCGDADHPGAAVAPHTQVQRVETGPVKVLLPIKRRLGDTKRVCQLEFDASIKKSKAQMRLGTFKSSKVLFLQK